MQNLQTAVLVICLTAAGLTLAEGLLPDQRFTRQVRLMTAAVLLTVMLKPLAGIRFGSYRSALHDSEAETEAVAELAEQAKEQAVCESLCSTLNREFMLREIPCQVTAVSAHIPADGCIVISEVQVSGNLLTAQVCLHEWLGADVSITEGGG